MQKIYQKKCLQYICLVYTVFLTMLILFGLFMIPMGFRIDAHAININDHVMQIVFMLLNIVCLVLVKRWATILLMIDICFLSTIQEKTWISLSFLLIISILFVFYKRKKVYILIKCTLMQSLVCIMLCVLMSVFDTNVFDIHVYHHYTNQNGEYIIESIQTYHGLEKTDSYYQCRKNNDISLLFYRLIQIHQPIGTFKYYDNNKEISVEWVSETEFLIDNHLYSVNSFPVHIE